MAAEDEAHRGSLHTCCKILLRQRCCSHRQNMVAWFNPLFLLLRTRNNGCSVTLHVADGSSDPDDARRVELLA